METMTRRQAVKLAGAVAMMAAASLLWDGAANHGRPACADDDEEEERTMKVFYNRETGEIFETRDAAIEDAREQYDFGDPTNMLTYLGFPNDELPYIEIEERQLKALFAAFG